jgi:hypothetical protein
MQAEVSHVAYPTDNAKREAWLHTRCKQLKHEAGALKWKDYLKRQAFVVKIKDKLSSALIYFKNHRDMMNYSTHCK